MITLPAALPPLLAAVPTGPAERVGYFIGIGVGLMLILGVGGLGVVSIILAFTRRTKGWIVLGAISGVILLAVAVFFVAAFTTGVVQGLKRAAETQAAKAGQKVTGQKLPFTVELPAGWTVKRGQGQFDFVASRGGTDYIGVIAEEMNVGDPQNVANFARDHLKSFATDVTLSEVEPLTLAEREWRQFKVKCKVQGIPFAYQYYVYTGDEGTFQILGWTFQNLWERRANALREVMQTFRFPPAVDTAETKP